MRRAVSAGAPRGAQTATMLSLPAPIHGANTRDPVSMVPQTQATYMADCYPTAAGIKLRPGYQTRVTGFPAIVRSLMVYVQNNGTETMFAASGTAFYNASGSGAVGAAVVSGLTNSKWVSVNFTNSSGTSYLCCFNGVDAPRYWDNATWTAVTGASTPSITGLTTTTIAQGFVHQRRLWLVQTNSLKVWYLPADSVGGAAQALDLGGVAYKGGYVVAGGAWTVDAGDGLNDYWMVITSEGQLIVYQGVDPSSASTWLHVGTWNVSEPTGRRCMSPFKSDVLITTRAGVVSAKETMQGNIGKSAMLTDIIFGTYSFLWSSALTSGDTDWCTLYYGDADLLFLSVEGSVLIPMNASTGAWGTGWSLNMSSVAIFGNAIFYGDYGGGSGTTTRALFYSGGLTESTVTGQIYTGFSDYGIPGVKKLSLLRCAVPYPTSAITLSWGAAADYEIPSALSDSQAFSSLNGVTPWVPLKAVGASISILVYIAAASTQSTVLSGFDVIFQRGGLIGSSVYT